MATLTIDLASVELLVDAALATALGASGVTYVPRGREQPEDADAVWCRISSINTVAVHTQRTADQPDRVGVTITVHVAAGPEAIQTSTRALATAMNLVRNAIGRKRLVDSPLTHVLVTDRGDARQDAEPDPMRLLCTGSVIVTGVCECVA